MDKIKVNGTTEEFKQLKKTLDDLSNKKTRFRSMKYSGKGRPKKSDYVICKIRDLRDALAFDLLANGKCEFKSEYIKN